MQYEGKKGITERWRRARCLQHQKHWQGQTLQGRNEAGNKSEYLCE